MNNVRHDLPADKVHEEIRRKIENLEQDKIRRVNEEQERLRQYLAAETIQKNMHKPDPKRVGRLYDEWIATEREHYALVRVIELPGKEEKRFVLAYGTEPDESITHGTGPFSSVADAGKWFFNSGR